MNHPIEMIASHLKQVRETLGLSVEEVCKALDISSEQYLNYEQAREELQRTVNQTSGGLEQMSRTLEGLNTVFAQQGQTLSGIVEQFQERGHRMPEPLPLEEAL